jgi:hypothetical protein
MGSTVFIIIQKDFRKSTIIFIYSLKKLFFMKRRVINFKKDVVANLSKTQMGNEKGGTEAPNTMDPYAFNCGTLYSDRCTNGCTGSGYNTACDYCAPSTYPYCGSSPMC